MTPSAWQSWATLAIQSPQTSGSGLPRPPQKARNKVTKVPLQLRKAQTPRGLGQDMACSCHHVLPGEPHLDEDSTTAAAHLCWLPAVPRALTCGFSVTLMGLPHLLTHEP